MVLNPEQMEVPNGVNEVKHRTGRVKPQHRGKLIGVKEQKSASNIHPQQAKTFP